VMVVWVVLLLLLEPHPAAAIAKTATNAGRTRAGALYLKNASFGRGRGVFYHGAVGRNHRHGPLKPILTPGRRSCPLVPFSTLSSCAV
jgi:hypothetical protein